MDYRALRETLRATAVQIEERRERRWRWRRWRRWFYAGVILLAAIVLAFIAVRLAP